MSEMVCLFCRKGAAQGVSLIRVNAKGQSGVWACRKHARQTDAKGDPELDEIVKIIAGQCP